MSSELENSGIRVAVGHCSVTERRRWRPPYQTDKTAISHMNTYTLCQFFSKKERKEKINETVPNRIVSNFDKTIISLRRVWFDLRYAHVNFRNFCS